MEVAILIILYLAGFLGVFFCFYQLAGILDKLTYQDQAVGSIKVWILKKLRYHHGPWVCNTNINKLAHYKCLPPYSAVCDDMFQLLPNASFIDPPPKWKRARTQAIQLKPLVRSLGVLPKHAPSEWQAEVQLAYWERPDVVYDSQR